MKLIELFDFEKAITVSFCQITHYCYSLIVPFFFFSNQLDTRTHINLASRALNDPAVLHSMILLQLSQITMRERIIFSLFLYKIPINAPPPYNVPTKRHQFVTPCIVIDSRALSSGTVDARCSDKEYRHSARRTRAISTDGVLLGAARIFRAE